jgi:hypothetical protein
VYVKCTANFPIFVQSGKSEGRFVRTAKTQLSFLGYQHRGLGARPPRLLCCRRRRPLALGRFPARPVLALSELSVRCACVRVNTIS